MMISFFWLVLTKANLMVGGEHENMEKRIFVTVFSMLLTKKEHRFRYPFSL
uniref:Uncharacterized protein n=1 Tax=Solanum lycopersicum TaxID=4081 RepID=A0A3Q7EXL9_SOLLC